MAQAAAEVGTALRGGGEREHGLLDDSLVGECDGEDFMGLSWEEDGEGVSLEGLDQEIEALMDHEVVKGILHQGCRVDEYAQEVESKLRNVELESIQDYITESDTLVELHDQIRSCDNILEAMEAMLGHFQTDLGSISSEIKHLQEQSLSMSVKLRNRKAAEEQLGKFIDDIAIPPALIKGIVEGEVDARFLELLKQLDAKLVFLAEDPAAAKTAAYQDVRPELEKLRAKAVAKGREFLMQRFYAFRKPKTNIQILQQNVLLKYRYLASFLRKQGQEVFTEVRTCYVDTLSRVLSSHFKAYLTSLERLHVEVATRTDLVGGGHDGVVAGAISSAFLFGRAASRRKGMDPLALGDRPAVLKQLEQSAIIPHVAEAASAQYPYELLFRSVHKLLMDTATSEYLFCTDFFGEGAVFHELFQATLSVVEGALSGALQDHHDAIGLLLMIRINYHHQLIMSRRRLPCLDHYLDRVNLLLWPRFKIAMDGHIASVREASTRAPSNHNASPHPVACRYAELAAAMHVLNADYQDQQLDLQLDRLEATVVDFVTRTSHNYSPRLNGMIFLINNFNHIITVLKEATPLQPVAGPGHAESSAADKKGPPLGASAAASLQRFEDQMSGCTSTYVEEQLRVYFEKLIDFVKKAEMRSKSTGTLAEEAVAEARPIVVDFARKWKMSIDVLHKETCSHFTSPVCGMEVLKAAMTQLLLYYTRLLDLLTKAGPPGATLAREAVSIPSIMYEIKRLTRT